MVVTRGKFAFNWPIRRTAHIFIGNSMICSDIWPKYHEWYYEIVIRNFTSHWASEIWDNFEISRVVFMPNINTNHAIICLYYYPQKVVIFTCRYFKLTWNTTALSQPNCRNFLCSGIRVVTHHQYRISQLIPQSSFCGKTWWFRKMSAVFSGNYKTVSYCSVIQGCARKKIAGSSEILKSKLFTFQMICKL